MCDLLARSLLPWLITPYLTKTYCETEVYLHGFLTSASDGREQSALFPKKISRCPLNGGGSAGVSKEQTLCCWMVKSRRMRWAGHVARLGERRGIYRVLMGKPERKRPLERPRRKWEDNNKMDLQDVGCVYGLNRVGSG